MFYLGVFDRETIWHGLEWASADSIWSCADRSASTRLVCRPRGRDQLWVAEVHQQYEVSETKERYKLTFEFTHKQRIIYIFVFKRAQHFDLAKHTFGRDDGLKYVRHFLERHSTSTARVRNRPNHSERSVSDHFVSLFCVNLRWRRIWLISASTRRIIVIVVIIRCWVVVAYSLIRRRDLILNRIIRWVCRCRGLMMHNVVVVVLKVACWTRLRKRRWLTCFYLILYIFKIWSHMFNHHMHFSRDLFLWR